MEERGILIDRTKKTQDEALRRNLITRGLDNLNMTVQTSKLQSCKQVIKVDSYKHGTCHSKQLQKMTYLIENGKDRDTGINNHDTVGVVSVWNIHLKKSFLFQYLWEKFYCT